VLSRPALAALVAACRKTFGLQQARLATDLGLSPAALSHMETTRSAISERFLSAFAERLFGERGAPTFIELVHEAHDDDIDEIAHFVFPSEPEVFTGHYETVLGKLVGKRRSPSKRGSGTQPVFSSAPMILRSQATDESQIDFSTTKLESLSRLVAHTPTSIAAFSLEGPKFQTSNLRRSDHDDAVRDLRAQLLDLGLSPRLSTRNTLRTGDGVRVRVDVVDEQNQLAFDVRDPGQYGFRFLAEMIAKSVLLRDLGFRFIVFYTQQPTSQLDLSLGASISRYGGHVAWPENAASRIGELLQA